LGTTTQTFSSDYHPYDPNIFYFIERFFTYTGFVTIIILSIVFIGLLIIILKNKPVIKDKFDNLRGINRNSKYKLLIFSILGLIFVLTFGQVHYLVSEGIFLAIGVTIYMLLKNLDIKDLDLHLLVLAWFMAFFIFNSVYVIKSDRYFILMAPAVAYFLILGLGIISRSLPVCYRNRNITFPIVTVILTVIILISTASYLPVIKEDNQGYKYSNKQIDLASEWFRGYEPNYRYKIIYSDAWPYLAWFLKTDIKIMPTFKNNQSYIGGVKNSTFTQQDSKAFNDYLVKNNADYYFCVFNINLTSFRPIKQFGSLIIYQRI
jgi:hypothetical protein